MAKIDLDTIAKEYAAGKISKEDFLYLHKMLTNPPAKKPAPQQPPVLNPARPARSPAGQAAQRQQQQRQPQRRIVKPSATGQPNAASQSDLIPVSQINLHIDDSLLEQAPSSVSVFGYIRRHHKEVVALIGTLGIFISMFYNKIQIPSDQGQSRVVMVQQPADTQPPHLRTQDIKLIAQLMMEDNSWNKELIDDFVTQWNKLSDNEKLTIKQSDWYLDFSSMLSQQIKTARIKAKTGDVSAIYSQQALLSLADSLVFGEDHKAQQLLAEAVNSNTIKSILNEPDEPAPRETPKTANKEKAVIKEKELAKPEIATRSEVKSTPSSSAIAKHRISRQEIEDVINRLTVAVEAGQTSDLVSLFADPEYSSSFAALNKVKKDYKELFQTTRDRQLDLSSFFWEHDFDEVRGSAKYTAKVTMKDAEVDRTITANLDITLRRLMGKIYITDFVLKNRKVVASSSIHKQEAKPKPLNTARNKNNGKPRHPTPAELQDLVTQYITAYETGDVKELMHLFANATWTKSRTGLVEMKQNYENLFTTTSGREVFIKNVDWKFKDDKALGTGDLLITLHTHGSQVETKKGKIRIVAEKSKDLVRFTQMFHIVDQ